jgi:hypothetical protein
MLVAYQRHYAGYYVKNGEVTNHVEIIRLALRVVNRLYGHKSVGDFGPLALTACRAEFVRQGLGRRECNRRINIIKQAFGWGTSNEVVPANVLHGLQSVKGLHRGRSEARETEPVRPVEDDVVEKTLEHLNPTVAAMVQIQRLTA